MHFGDPGAHVSLVEGSWAGSAVIRGFRQTSQEKSTYRSFCFFVIHLNFAGLYYYFLINPMLFFIPNLVHMFDSSLQSSRGPVLVHISSDIVLIPLRVSPDTLQLTSSFDLVLVVG